MSSLLSRVCGSSKTIGPTKIFVMEKRDLTISKLIVGFGRIFFTATAPVAPMRMVANELVRYFVVLIIDGVLSSRGGKGGIKWIIWYIVKVSVWITSYDPTLRMLRWIYWRFCFALLMLFTLTFPYGCMHWLSHVCRAAWFITTMSTFWLVQCQWSRHEGYGSTTKRIGGLILEMYYILSHTFRNKGLFCTSFPLQWRHHGRDGISNHLKTFSASPAFVRGIHQCPVNSPHKWPVTRKCFHLMTSLCPWRFANINKTSPRCQVHRDLSSPPPGGSEILQCVDGMSAWNPNEKKITFLHI